MHLEEITRRMEKEERKAGKCLETNLRTHFWAYILTHYLAQKKLGGMDVTNGNMIQVYNIAAFKLILNFWPFGPKKRQNWEINIAQDF